VSARPGGIHSKVEQDGRNFSGGQRQRLEIARALVRNPSVLVLDEATSALDNETERLVQHAFDELAVGRTTVTIAHRLSTVRNADQIVVMRGGRILEAGTHDSLISMGGFYATLTA